MLFLKKSFLTFPYVKNCHGSHLGFFIVTITAKLLQDNLMHISKIAYQICWVVSEKRFFKYQPIKTYYWPWQPFWIFYQHQKPKFCKVPPTEHFLPSLVTMGNVGLEKKCKTFRQQRTKSDDNSSHDTSA